MKEEAKIKSLDKALNILECFTPAQPQLGITEISERLGLYKSNVHNILSTLMQRGYVEQDPVTSRYYLGLKFLELAFVINNRLDLNRIVAPYMQEIAEQAGESVYFGIPKNGKVVYLDAAYPSPSYHIRPMMGETAEMYCTAIGKAILAFLPPETAGDALVLQSMKPFTADTIIGREQLTRELEQIRIQGYSIDNMEHEFGIRCVGVPVFDRTHTLIGGMSISGPSLRFEDDAICAYAAKLKDHAAKIASRLQ